MCTRRAPLLLAACLFAGVAAAALIPAGAPGFTLNKPSHESDKLGTGAGGGGAVTNDYLVTSFNEMAQPICDLIITLEDEKGGQIPADGNNDIESVTVQNKMNGANQGAAKTYAVGGAASTQARVTLDPCIPGDPGPGTAGADITIKAKTDKAFNRIHITISKKETASNVHHGMAGTFSQGFGTDAALVIPPLEPGVVFFVTNSDATDPVRRGRFRLAGTSLPLISKVRIDDATEAFTVEVHSDGKGFGISGGSLAPGETMEVWVELAGPTSGDAAVLGRLMRD